MADQNFKISQVTLAVTNADEMAEFYQKVFDVKLNGFDAMGTKFYSGNIAGLNIMLCPNSIAGVDAKQSRHQFDYKVSDLDSLVKNAIEAGGTMQGKVEESDKQKSVTIIDPDGNTMNFIENK